MTFAKRVWVEAQFNYTDPRTAPGYAIFRVAFESADGKTMPKTNMSVAVTTLSYKAAQLDNSTTFPSRSALHAAGVQSWYGSALRNFTWATEEGSDAGQYDQVSKFFIPYATVRSVIRPNQQASVKKSCRHQPLDLCPRLQAQSQYKPIQRGGCAAFTVLDHARHCASASPPCLKLTFLRTLHNMQQVSLQAYTQKQQAHSSRWLRHAARSTSSTLR